MSHEIYNNAFVTYREPAWHKLGIVFDQPINAAEAWALMGPYDVSKRQLHYNQDVVTPGLLPGIAPTMTTEQIMVKDKYVLVGDFPDGKHYSYGVVDKKYELVTPKDLVNLWDMTVKANIETMGTLQQGKRFFLTTELPSFDVKGDEHKNFLSIISPHGTMQSLMGIISPVRVVCWNTLQCALAMAKQECRIWHQKGALNKLGVWLQGQYDSTGDRSAAYAEALNILASAEVSDSQLANYMDELIPVNVAEAMTELEETKATKALDARADIMHLFRGNATGADTKAFKDTTYGLYNAVVEWADYHKKGTKAGARWLGVNSNLKEKAFDLAMDLATK
jgi:phage/plasmid-like protein (TIGR03299 family)